jgi:hypothetical protein
MITIDFATIHVCYGIEKKFEWLVAKTKSQEDLHL